MVKYLDLANARSLSIETAMELAPVYGKFSFESGLKICDQVLVEMFEGVPQRNEVHEMPKHDLDLLIDVFLLAIDAHLKDTVKHAVSYFQGVLGSPYRYDKIMFSKDQIKKLMPLIVKENLLSGEWTTGGELATRRIWSNEEIKSPLFPEHFVLFLRSEVMSQELNQKSVVQVRLLGSGCNADGAYNSGGGCFFFSNREGRYGGANRIIYIGRREEENDDWVMIYGETEAELDEHGEPDEDTIDTKMMWRNPYSNNLPLPPHTGWKSVDELARGDIEIEYIYRENE